jgi:hypothetical protein
VLRRTQQGGRALDPGGTCYAFGDWVLREVERVLVDADGNEVALSSGEYHLLYALVRHPRQVMSRDRLLDLVRGREADIFDRAIDNLVSRLRKKIEVDAAHPQRVKLRLWPKSLIGQLVFAVAVMLFVAQAINFVLLSRGQKQQILAHGGGMAVARVIDAIERDRRGDFRRPRDEHEERERAQKLVISDTPPSIPAGAVRLPDLAAYVSGCGAPPFPIAP